MHLSHIDGREEEDRPRRKGEPISLQCLFLPIILYMIEATYIYRFLCRRKPSFKYPQHESDEKDVVNRIDLSSLRPLTIDETLLLRNNIYARSQSFRLPIHSLF